MNKLATIFLTIMVGLGSAILGYSIGRINSGPSQDAQVVLQSIKDLPEGSELVLNESQLDKIVEEKEYNGATSEKIYFRMMSWAGVGGPEAAMGDMGIQTEDMKIGVSKGQSWITGLWKFIKSIFWFAVLYFAIWLILSAVSIIWPPAGIIAGIMAAIATAGISAIGSIINWFKNKQTKTALVQTISGVDEFKVAHPELKVELNNELKKAQDSSSKDIVDAIRK